MSPLTGIAVDEQQHGDDQEGAQRVGEQVQGLGDGAHRDGRLRVEELQRGDGRQDLGRAHQGELEGLWGDNAE